MQGRNPSEPSLFQMVDVEALVPPDHRLRRIDAVLDLSFAHEAVAQCYSAGCGARPGQSLSRARRRGLRRVQIQMDLSAAVQNLKRLAAHADRRPRKAAAMALAPYRSEARIRAHLLRTIHRSGACGSPPIRPVHAYCVAPKLYAIGPQATV